MSSIIDTLYVLKYNPFKYGEYIASFYSSASDINNNLLLLPLIIPLCSYKKYQQKIENARFGKTKSSSIHTVFSDKTELCDLQERIEEFQNLTQASMQYALANDWLLINTTDLTITASSQDFEQKKITINLGKLFANRTILDIYSFLGVKKI